MSPSLNLNLIAIAHSSDNGKCRRADQNADNGGNGEFESL